MVGRSAAMNQSETKAAPTPPAASRPTDTPSGTRGARSRRGSLAASPRT